MPTRRVPRMQGQGLMSSLMSGLKKLHTIVKENKLASKGLKAFGHHKLAGIASQMGYGRKRRVARRRVRR